MEDFMGSIQLVTFNFAPPGYLPCDGRLLHISQYTALFSLIGTTYGGDGVNNFALPKLAAPIADMQYIIACEGVYPSRP